MKRLILLGMVALTLVGCQRDLDVTSTSFRCDSREDCIDGFACVNRDGVLVCVEESTLGGGGGFDAGNNGTTGDGSGGEDTGHDPDVVTPVPDTGEDTCGDGVVDPNEDCDDQNSSQDDFCLNDCTDACGDGVVQSVEVCDIAISEGDPGTCPISCDDGEACTSDEMVGEDCQAQCQHTAITACGDDDGCCPAGCHFGTDNDCQPFYVAMIRDTSAGASACNASDPGSDLQWVRLDDGNGQVVGYAVALDYMPGTGNNNQYTRPDLVLDGSTRTQNCVSSFETDTVLALGCGGWVTVKFGPDAFQIFSGDQIVVNEYGSNVCSGSSADSYEVLLCLDSAAAVNGDVSSCTHLLADNLGGLQSVAVTFPEN